MVARRRASLVKHDVLHSIPCVNGMYECVMHVQTVHTVSAVLSSMASWR